MTDFLKLFKEKNALLEGHFVLSSGLHSNRYLQSALILSDPKTAELLGKSIADLFSEPIDVVVSPAIGGLIIGHEVARAKGSRAIFSEKNDEGKPVLRRNFEIGADEKVLVIEDVVTTGLSTGEVMSLIDRSGGKVVGVGSIVNRSGKAKAAFAAFDGTGESKIAYQLIDENAARSKDLEKVLRWKVPVRSLLTVDVQTWNPTDCELCKQGTPAVKPGSRKK